MSARNKQQEVKARNQPRSGQEEKSPNKLKSRSSLGESSNSKQFEVNCQLNELIAEVMERHNVSVKAAQARQLVNMMAKQFKFFKTAFINLIDKILVLEEKDQLIRNIYSLISKFFQETLKVHSQLNQVEVNSLFSSFVNHLIQTYFLGKCPQQVQSRAAFFLSELSCYYGLTRIKLENEVRMQLQDMIIDLFHQSRTTLMLYGVQLACELSNQNNAKDPLYVHLMKTLSHCSSKEVRKACIQHLKAPFSQMTLLLLGNRLRDKDDDIRRQTFQKLAKCRITIESFPSKEQRMLYIKEGLTDPNNFVREACLEFLRPSVCLTTNQGDQDIKVEMIEDLSIMFKFIDCKQMFIKEYYIQLPFIIMRFMFEVSGQQDIILAQYCQSLLKKLKLKAGLIEDEDQEMGQNITFEEILFLRIAYEFTKMYRVDRSEAFLELMETISVSFDDYYSIFQYLLLDPNTDRLIFGEWVKFSLQLAIEDEVTRRNLVSLMFDYIGQVSHSYFDYQSLLKYNRISLQNDLDLRGLELALDAEYHQQDDIWDQQQQQEEDQVIEIEIREFRDLEQKRDIHEYCKPFSFESLVRDSDDVCRIAVIVARKLLDARIDEFSLSMLQAISDIKEPLEENPDEAEFLSFKMQRDIIFKKMEQKLDQVNELVTAEDYSASELNKIMSKVRHYVALIEELNLKEKLSFKRALNLCLILLKQCRADVNDQNLISICETLIGPTIQSKDKDNMLLAIECIGLLCLLDKELFQNYSKIFQTILTEDVQEDNLREKIIALKSSVDSLIIHGVESKTTQKLQRIIIEDYMVIKDRILRQITIEGICKMLFSRKLTQDADHNEMEFLLSQLIIQWFDRRFNWQNSLVRQVLNQFFKSFVLFSEQRCELMLRALTKVIYSILESKYGSAQNDKKKSISGEKNKKKGKHGSERSSSSSGKKKKKRYNRESSDDDMDEEDSAYDIGKDQSFISDDSRCAQNQAYMEKICSELDAVQITKVFLLLLSKDYVNQNAAKEFQLSKDLPVEFLLGIAYANAMKLKKVAVVKDYIVPLIDHVSAGGCQDTAQLKLTAMYIEMNAKMLVQAQPKLKKFIESIDRRIEYLTKEQEENGQNHDVNLLMQDEQPPLDAQHREAQLSSLVDKLQSYYYDEILGTLIDLVQDDDDEYFMQLHGLDGLKQLIASPIKEQRRASNASQEEEPSITSMSLRRRRSGLRSNKKRLMNTAQDCYDTKKLKSIPEVEEHTVQVRDISSSEKAPKINAKLLNDTILEERESLHRDQEMEGISNSYHDDDSQQENIIADRDHRRGIMSKLSKKMARDFAVTKKQSLSHQSSLSQYQDAQRLKEEYLDRTVYKINKTRSPIRGALASHQQDAAQQQLNQVTSALDELNYVAKPQNLSVTFDKADNSFNRSKEDKEESKIGGKSKKPSQKGRSKENQIPKEVASLKQQAARMTRSQMKSFSESSNQSNGGSSSESDLEDDTFDFMKSKLSKQAKKGGYKKTSRDGKEGDTDNQGQFGQQRKPFGHNKEFNQAPMMMTRGARK